PATVDHQVDVGADGGDGVGGVTRGAAAGGGGGAGDHGPAGLPQHRLGERVVGAAQGDHPAAVQPVAQDRSPAELVDDAVGGGVGGLDHEGNRAGEQPADQPRERRGGRVVEIAQGGVGVGDVQGEGGGGLLVLDLQRVQTLNRGVVVGARAH